MTHPLTDRADRIAPSAYWELLMNLTKREVKGRYSQSFFGIAWAIAQPLATMVGSRVMDTALNDMRLHD